MEILLYLKPNRQRAKTVTTMLWVMAGMSIVVLAALFSERSAITENSTGLYAGMSDAMQSSILLVAVLTVLRILLLIATAVVFIQWFRRAYYNLHLIAGNLSHEESWAAISWFIPIANLGIPVQIMSELFRETRYYISRTRPEQAMAFPRAWLGLWWTGWILMSILGNFSGLGDNKYSSFDDKMTGNTLGILSMIVSAGNAIVAIRMIKIYSDMEQAVRDILAEPAVKETPPEQPYYYSRETAYPAPAVPENTETVGNEATESFEEEKEDNRPQAEEDGKDDEENS